MTQEMLKSVLDAIGAKSTKADTQIPEGRTLTLHVAHAGAALNVSRVVAIGVSGGLVRARNQKDETYWLSLEDVFAIAVDGGEVATSARRTGFLPPT